MEQGKGELRFEVSTGLGRIDILLTYQGRKYIVETKINRSSLDRTTKKAIDQLCSKYLLTERANEGYVVIFDPKTAVGELSLQRKFPHQCHSERPQGAKNLFSMLKYSTKSQILRRFAPQNDNLRCSVMHASRTAGAREEDIDL